ncbi:LuxR C-terminal-related transcriptional regulator [Parasalinivibrio latis]|uniref:LuxR C-terminal-related transcriptional regulator n=1 Tax=Parasalinivibrio latis TaxID=2952610 RepID=UPI0030E364F3
MLYRLRDVEQPVVLISGYPGSGKTRTLSMLAEFLDVELQDRFQGADQLRAGERVIIDVNDAEEGIQLEMILRQLPAIQRKNAHIYLSGSSAINRSLLNPHVLYKNLVIFHSRDLFFSIAELKAGSLQDAETLYAETAGWPILVDNVARFEDPLFIGQWQEFVSGTLLPAFSFGVVKTLIALSYLDTLPLEHSGLTVTDVEFLAPIVQMGLGGTLYLGIPKLREPLRKFANKNSRYRQQAMRTVAKSLYASGKTTQAIVIAANSGNHDLAINWFEENGNAMYGFVHGFRAVNEILAAVPASVADGNLYICWAKLISMLKSGDISGAARQRDWIKRRYADQTDLIKLINATLVPYENSEPTESYCQSLEQLHTAFRHNPLYLGLLHNEICVNYIELGLFDKAAVCGAVASRSYRESGTPYLAFFICLHMSNIYIEQGKLDEAEGELEKARHCLKQVSFADELYNEQDMIYLDEARIALLRGNLNQARDLWRCIRFDEGGRELWVSMMRDYCWCGILVTSLAEGTRKAIEMFERLKADYWQVMGVSYEAEFSLVTAYLMQQKGQWHHSEAILGKRLSTNRRDKLAKLVTLRGRIAAITRQNKPDGRKAGKLISSIEKDPPPESDIVSRIYSLVHKSHLYRVVGNEILSRNTLKDALLLSGKTGIRLPFLLEFEWIVPPLQELQSARMAGSEVSVQVQLLLPMISAVYETENNTKSQGPLTGKETLILARLNEGMTNKEIARLQGVSENTVKYHLKQMFLRVGCNSRKQLLEVAREHRWI